MLMVLVDAITVAVFLNPSRSLMVVYSASRDVLSA
jgi:hypothetical protein